MARKTRGAPESCKNAEARLCTDGDDRKPHAYARGIEDGCGEQLGVNRAGAPGLAVAAQKVSMSWRKEEGTSRDSESGAGNQPKGKMGL